MMKNLKCLMSASNKVMRLGTSECHDIPGARYLTRLLEGYFLAMVNAHR